jgi:hypothetical protein
VGFEKLRVKIFVVLLVKMTAPQQPFWQAEAGSKRPEAGRQIEIDFEASEFSTTLQLILPSISALSANSPSPLSLFCCITIVREPDIEGGFR